MIVADSSPLIALARIGHLDLLPQLFDSVAIPPAVDEEIEHDPKGLEGERPAWIGVLRIDDPITIAPFRSRLDRGESEVLALGLQLNLPVLIDEARGRRVGSAAGLTIIGTLGVLIRAKRVGLVDRVQPPVERLRATGFRLRPELIAEALRLAGEA